MRIAQSLIASTVIAIATLVPAAVVAQAPMDRSKMHGNVADLKTDTSKDLSEGEVRKVDKNAGKLTIKHGELRNLDMPAMTMVFLVKDKVALDKLQTGDKIKFKALSENGKLVATEIQSTK